MKIYMIRGKKNGKYLAAGMSLTKNGKCWTSLGALKNALQLNRLFRDGVYKEQYTRNEPEGYDLITIDVDGATITKTDMKEWCTENQVSGA